MTTTTTAERAIEMPRLDGERPERYEARMLYIRMGADRSLEAVGQRLGKSKALMERWSSADNWVEHAARYDQTVYTLAAQDAAAAYRADLEAHRKKAMDAGRSLFQVAGLLLRQLNDVLGQPKKIEGKDGRIYTIHAIELNSTTLAIAGRAMTAALDLEAHALGVDKLLPTLAADDGE